MIHVMCCGHRPHLFRWMTYRIGNRGVVLVVLGIIWLLIGVSVYLMDPNSASARLPDTFFIPEWLRAAAWIGPATWAIFTPFVRKRGDDYNAWALLMIGPAGRFVTYVAAGIIDLFHFRELDYQLPILGMAVWLAMVVLVDRCAAGLDRLPPARLLEGEDDGH